MNYSLQQLRVFECIARLGSVTAAAKELHLTQPAVSLQLKSLQDAFDLPLTERIGRGLHITPFGRDIAQVAENILREVDEINYRALQHNSLLAGKLSIMTVSTGKYVMPYFLTAFMRAHPGVELSLDVTSRSAVLDELAHSALDFALVSILPDSLPVKHITLMKNELFLVGRPDGIDPNKGGDEILRTDPLLFREQGSGTRSTMEEYLGFRDIPFRKGLELTSNEAVKQALLAGLGFSVMPLIGIRQELEQGLLKIIPVTDFPLTTSWRLIWRIDKKLSPVAKAYLEFVNEHKDSIINEYFKASK
ncbi:MAG: LysR family transcriptional regulator [Flavobacteriales bacterium]|nr:LysR family transcriptional regulator [Flavobacteriales bacterium]